METIIEMLDIPASSYILQSGIVDYTTSWELYRMADVLLLPSKTGKILWVVVLVVVALVTIVVVVVILTP